MNIIDVGIAGTVESSDIMVTVRKNKEVGNKVQLTSTVEKQFGTHIRKLILDCLDEMHVENAYVIAMDRGALDCTIKARVCTAVHRSGESKDYCWRKEK